jgi:hypothetical protein
MAASTASATSSAWTRVSAQQATAIIAEWQYIFTGLQGWNSAKPSAHKQRQIVAFLEKLAELRRALAET